MSFGPLVRSSCILAAEEIGSNRVHFSGMLLAVPSDDVMQKTLAERSNNSRSASDLV